MKKIAFFVEGQTEQIFVDKLVRNVLGEDRISIIIKRFVGGTNAPKQELVRSASFARHPDIHVLIYDCGADNRVKTEILENMKSLTESGYSHIVGLRDLYPLPIEELSRLEKGLTFLPSHLKKHKDAYNLIVVVQEIETWFLAETHHFRKVDRRLTGSFIHQRLGFNPFSINAEERRHPSRDLNNIYHLVGKSYTKRYWQVQKLVNRLDFDYIDRHLKYELASLGKLIEVLDELKR
ncbi:DUF4276 family protein [Dysgonomonas sp. 216]|uniref:DUF4276 family protein n=1 Tax=Dysgonomonas sp. 216 TaxID=2302934 RepID=UPI0013D5B4E9|nr:DUF4276 family protein [Dysgonomonas sp. 216]NDW19567.1 DUF4276 family protein [Dysgonomonas sp. 216]